MQCRLTYKLTLATCLFLLNLLCSAQKPSGYASRAWFKMFEKSQRAYEQNDFKSAVHYLDSTFQHCQTCNDSILAMVHERYGILVQYLEINAEGIFHLDTSYNLVIRNNWDPNFNGNIIISYAEVLRANQQFVAALDRINEALNYSRENELNKEVTARLYNRLVAIHSANQFPRDSIYKTLLIALEKTRFIGDSSGVALLYRELANIQGHWGESDKALKLNHMAKSAYESVNDERGIVEVLINLGNNYMALKRPNELKQIAKELIIKSREYDFKETLMWGYLFMSRSCADLGMYKEAYENLRRKDELDKYYFSEDWQSRINAYYKELELASRERYLENLRLEQEALESRLKLAKKERQLNQWIIYSIASVLIVIVAFVFHLSLNLRKQKKQAKEKEFLLREVHHRVKNNLQSLGGLLSLQIDYLDSEEQKKLLQNVYRRVNAISLTHSMLYNNEELDSVKAKKYITKLISEIINSEELAERKVNTKLEIAPIPLNFDQAICVGIITNELITNSFKHAVPEGQLEINLDFKVQGNTGVYSYCDNGKILKLKGKSPQSLGLKLIEIALKRLDGQVVSQEGKGFMYAFKFKLEG
ncbi:sensor histidine kinase [Luteibaculum oceani]|uniref:histidine kinase n=1 Tax=Luteibaculum oceani TaxID=1294296 RepID=A0A5C6VLG0_9FLAO|nr:sensor histidine kinase [Luteibaculum oceani]TXC85256.1 sensor histidine kinase [Luteibaculum oceani]